MCSNEEARLNVAVKAARLPAGIDKPTLVLKRSKGQTIGLCISMIFNFAKRK